MIDLREKKTSKKEDEKEIKFINKGDEFKSDKADIVKIIDVDKKDDKTEVIYKLGDEEKKGDIEDVLKMLNGAEYSKVEDKKDDDKKESVDKNSVKTAFIEKFDGKEIYITTNEVTYDELENIEDYLNDVAKDLKTLKNAKYIKKIDGSDWLVIPKGARVTINDIGNTYEVTLLDLPYEISFDFYDIDNRSFKYYGKKESAVVEAEGKKFVIYCTSKNEKDIPSGYVGDNDNYKTLKDLIAAEGKDVFFDSEKKAKDLIDDDPTIQANIKDGAKYTVKDVTDDLDEKKESAEDDFVEVTLAEDFHVPGTDVILEAGDVIRVVPKKVVESKSDDKENMLELIIDYVQENGLTDTYNFKQLISLLKDVVKDFENAEDMLY